MDNAHGRQKVVLWAAVIATIAGIVVAAVAMWGDRSEPDPAIPDPQESAASDGCTDVEAQSIELNGQVVEPEPRTCFELTETQQVTIGAAALEPTDLIELTLFDAAGEQLAAAVSEPDWDPSVGLELTAGTYVIEVAGVDTETVPPFLLHTATFPPQAAGEGDVELPGPEILPGGADLPTIEACGADVPWLATGQPVAVSNTADAPAGAGGDVSANFTCVEVTETVFGKIGIESPDPYGADSPDLTLAVYQFSDGGAEPELIRVGDDAFGSDPEVSLDLTPGTYLVEGAAWHDVSAGDYEFYYDDTASLFRAGDVTAMHAGIAADFCAAQPIMTVGDAITIDGEQTYSCVEVTEGGRLTIQAATLTDQDLALEVIGFNDDGPYRLAWTDDNPHSQALIDFDPLLDQHIPAGQWIVAVTTYYGDPAAGYDLQIVAGGGQ